MKKHKYIKYERFSIYYLKSPFDDQNIILLGIPTYFIKEDISA